MAETKHTPGPWSTEQQVGANGLVSGPIIETDHRAGVDRKGRHSRTRIGWASLAWADTNEGAPGDHPENIANARLIAAAPDMLEALKAAERLAWEVGSESDDGVNTILEDSRGDLWRQITAAIAKAEGGAK